MVNQSISSPRRYASLVKFEHTIFALPFAYAGAALAVDVRFISFSWKAIVWVTIAMVAARTSAMALNRVIDAKIDAQNPRTATREIPAGVISRRAVWVLALLSVVVLVLATTQLDPITRVLWPVPVALFVLYPFVKRFSFLCHAVLGLSIGLAPLAAWLALGGPADQPQAYLAWLGIALWIGGFDIIYATADAEFDRTAGLHSVPARFGIARALMVVRLAHVGAVAAFAGVGLTAGLGLLFWLALLVAAGLLAWENSIISANDLSRVDQAFFGVNSWVGVILGGGIIADIAIAQNFL